jgi:hypothetical protein
MTEDEKRADPIVWWAGAIVFVIILFVLFMCSPAHAQENHDQHHAQYQNWQSNTGFSCCNNNDCGELPAKDVREHDGQTEILVKDPAGDEWCPVTKDHLINQSLGPRQSPDWSVAHACILQSFPDRKACERFKCFMPAAKF